MGEKEKRIFSIKTGDVRNRPDIFVLKKVKICEFIFSVIFFVWID